MLKPSKRDRTFVKGYKPKMTSSISCSSYSSFVDSNYVFDSHSSIILKGIDECEISAFIFLTAFFTFAFFIMFCISYSLKFFYYISGLNTSSLSSPFLLVSSTDIKSKLVSFDFISAIFDFFFISNLVFSINI